MKHLFRFTLLTVCLLFANAYRSSASHMMGTDMWYTYIGPNQYKITLSFYYDCTSTLVMGSTLPINITSASCGQSLTANLNVTVNGVEVSPLCPSQLGQSTCNGGTLPGVLQYVYEAIITLPAQCSDWVVYYEDCCRNNAITNLPTPGSLGFHVEAHINNLNGLVDSSPSFTSLPVPYVCANQPYFYNHGAYDMDGDSLVYTQIPPIDYAGAGNISYNAPFSPTYPLSTTTGTVNFDQTTGQMSFTADAQQVTVVAIRVDEYRNGVLIGSSMRDIEIIVLICNNNAPVITNAPTNVQGGYATGNTSFQVCPGQTLSFDFQVDDPNAGDSIFLTTNLATVMPGATVTYTGANPVMAHFTWQPSGIDTGFHSFTVTVKDNYCPISGQNTYSYQVYVLSGVSAGPDVTLCGTQTAQLHATGGNQFTWSPTTGLSNPNIANPIATPTVTTTYTVTGNLSSGCSNVDDMVVFVVPDFTPSVTAGDTLCAGQSLQMTASASGGGSPYTYHWLPNSGLPSNTIANPLATPSVSTTYTVTITSAQGCTHNDSIPVIIAGTTPQFTLEPVDTVCAGSPAQLQAVVGGSIANCVPVFSIGCTDQDEIDHFKFNTLLHDSIGCAGLPSVHYYPSSSGYTTTVNMGSTYNIEMQSNLAWSEGFAVWIDYDHNGDFGGPGELVYQSPSAANTLFSGTVTIPMTATPGSTRMRVICRYAIVPSSTDYCNTSMSFGECEDYDVFINGSAGANSLTYQWSPGNSLNDSTVANPIAAPNQTTTYKLTVSYNGYCPKTDSVTVFVKQGSSTNLGDTTICINNDVLLQSPSGASNYSWTSVPAGLVSTQANVLVTPTITTTYFFSGTSNSQCIHDSLTVTVLPLPAVGLTPNDTTICFGSALTLSASMAYDTFHWQPAVSLSDSVSASVTAAPDSSTLYYVVVSNAAGCRSQDSVMISVLPFVIPQTIADTSICPNTVAILGVQADTTYQAFVWTPAASVNNPSIADPDATPQQTTTYTVVVTNALGCTGYDTMVVTVFAPNYVVATSDQVIQPGQSVTLHAGVNGSATYSWTSSQGAVTNGWLPDITVQPYETTSYTVDVTDYNNCQSTASMTVFVEPGCQGIHVPNAFSPNGDGINDKLDFYMLGLDEFKLFRVYNRWGELVFETNKRENTWDGTYKNAPAPLGVYVYYATVLCNGKESVTSGTVTLMR